MCGLFGHRLHHDRFQVDRQRRTELSRSRDGRGRGHAAQRLHPVVNLQRHAQRRQLVERHAQAVDVAAGVGRSPPLFRSHVEQGAQHVPRAADDILIGGFGQSEVGHPGCALGVEQQIARLHVAMQRSLAVRIFEGLRHLQADKGHVLPIRATDLPQRLRPAELGTTPRADGRRRVVRQLRLRARGRRHGVVRETEVRAGCRFVCDTIAGRGFGDGFDSLRRCRDSAVGIACLPIRREPQRLRIRAARSPEPADDRVEPHPLDILHHEIVEAVLLADAQNRHDVRMVQAAGRPRFAEESPAVRIVEPRVTGQHFHRHATAKRFLHGLVDDAHAAAADLSQDAEVAQAL